MERGYRLFDSFYEATRAYREKCNDNEQLWRCNHWQKQPRSHPREPTPVTPVLFSTLESMLADIMDHYPEPVLLGQEPGDDALARQLTKVVQFVLSRCHYRGVFRNKCRQALKMGASVQEVYWDSAQWGGLGEVGVRELDIRNFVWDPRFEDIQDGRACFAFEEYPRSWFAQRYPDAEPMMHADAHPRGYMPRPRAAGEEQMILLVDYWYREYDAKEERYRVHRAQFAGGQLLWDSREHKPEGVYAHGMYPFLVEPLYALDGQPVGLGMVDVLKGLQIYADKLDQIILKNALLSSKPRLLVNRNADLDEQALADMNSELIHGARIDEGAVRWMQAQPLAGYMLMYQQQKLSAIKEESGQNHFSRGESMGGVTAASAIIALQEAGNKRSRMLIEQLYDGFEKLVRMMVALVLENYTERRRFRVAGEDVEVHLADADTGIDFDVRVQVQKQTPYSTLYQNELAMQLAGAGMISAEQALRLMRFEGRDELLAGAQGAVPGGVQPLTRPTHG